MSWENAWRGALGLDEGFPSGLIALACLILIFSGVVIPVGMLLSYLARKFEADLQARVGPNRAGAAGILQPLADALKLLQKAALPSPTRGRGFWEAARTGSLFSTLAAIPLGSAFLLVDSEMSVFLPFWAILMVALCTLMIGLDRDDVPGWEGGFRVASQAITGVFPAMIALLCAAISAGGYRWSDIAAHQGFSPVFWTAINPFQFLAFLVFVTSGLVVLGVTPMEGASSRLDLHGGVDAQKHGWRLISLGLARFYAQFLWSVIAVVLFLGAWTLPAVLNESMRDNGNEGLLSLLELGWLTLKAVALMLAVQWVVHANPRSRIDQMTDLSWKVLGPASIIALIGTAAGKAAF